MVGEQGALDPPECETSDDEDDDGDPRTRLRLFVRLELACRPELL
jgi:hypothetical protein